MITKSLYGSGAASLRFGKSMTPAQCRSARDLLGWEPTDLARAAGVSVIAVRNFERDKPSPRRSHITAMQRALEGAGITFAGAGPCLKRPSSC